MTYVYQAWPSWRYGPNGEAEIFEDEDQVPEGWLDHPSKFKAAAPAPAANHADSAGDDPLKALIDDFSQKELADHLTEMQKVDETIEFSANWPKAKLAQVILASGGTGPEKEA